MVLGLGRPAMSMVLVQPQDDSAVPEKALVVDTILVVRSAP